MLNASAFLEAFWPNLVATFLGVAGGGAVAFLGDRAAGRSAARSAEREQERRHAVALDAVVRDLERFATKEMPTIVGTDPNAVTTNVLWPTAAWNAFAAELGHLRNAELRLSLFATFGALDRLRQSIEYHQHLVASLPSVQYGPMPSPQARVASQLRAHIIEAATEIDLQGLVTSIRVERSNLRLRDR